MQNFSNVNAYIQAQALAAQPHLQDLRNVIRSAAPDAAESISYGMPAYKFKGKPLVYFGAFKSHIGFYATPTGHTAFADELANYKQGKGSVQFPMDKPMPLDLVKRMVEFKVSELMLKTT